MPTKAELEARIQDLELKAESLESDIRRTKRALGQAHLDLNVTVKEGHNHLTPHITEHARKALARAKAELDLVVKDPCSRIDKYIKSSEGLGWSWVEPYTKNGQFAWCGAFASFCYPDVHAQIRKKIFPSCYRLYSNWAQTSRKISVENIQAGDLVIVYTSKRSVQGDHITLCTDASTAKDGYITTIEGNAHGTLGDGTKGEGVITRQRELHEVAHVYRLLGVDFNE